MKLSEEALLEIMNAFQTGLIKLVDISDLLRSIDLEDDGSGKLQLSKDYKRISVE